jgi:NAD(P)-dependent dehydrogenase (short-subunit alcohol dehydrogenase family)
MTTDFQNLQGLRSLFDLEGKVAIVTGASSGIGESISRELASSGAKVAVAGIDDVGCRRVADFLIALGAEAIAVHCDVSVPEDLMHLVETTVRHLGPINILVCNAGVAPHFGPIGSASDAQYELTMNINLRSVLRLTSLVIPEMARLGHYHFQHRWRSRKQDAGTLWSFEGR